jgi:1-acyl-sn-glycerol-3-phosphate acyltransferase
MSSFWSSLLKAQVISIASITILLSTVAKFAAMRGTKRKPFPGWLDKLLRAMFFFSLVAPSYVYMPRAQWALILISTLYLPSYLNGGEKSAGPTFKRPRSLLQRMAKNRLNLTLVRTAELNPASKYIMGIHPHGILPFGGIINMCSDVTDFGKLFPGLDCRCLAASFCFYLPLYREFCMGMGLRDAARYSAHRILAEGKSVMLVPGGATEALYAYPNTNILVLRKRAGFIKLALETGASLVPVYTFGETDTYDQWSMNYKFVRWLKTSFQYVSGLSLPLITNILPRPCRVTTVVGKPIPVTKVDDPTDAQVKDMMEIYIKAVTELYTENQPKYSPEAGPLEVK